MPEQPSVRPLTPDQPRRTSASALPRDIPGGPNLVGRLTVVHPSTLTIRVGPANVCFSANRRGRDSTHCRHLQSVKLSLVTGGRVLDQRHRELEVGVRDDPGRDGCRNCRGRNPCKQHPVLPAVLRCESGLWRAHRQRFSRRLGTQAPGGRRTKRRYSLRLRLPAGWRSIGSLGCARSITRSLSKSTSVPTAGGYSRPSNCPARAAMPWVRWTDSWSGPSLRWKLPSSTA